MRFRLLCSKRLAKRERCTRATGRLHAGSLCGPSAAEQQRLPASHGPVLQISPEAQRRDTQTLPLALKRHCAQLRFIAATAVPQSNETRHLRKPFQFHALHGTGRTGAVLVFRL
jgi:hypothetical protein